MLHNLSLFVLSAILWTFSTLSIAKAPCASEKDCACIAEMQPICQKMDKETVGECSCVERTATQQ